MRGVLSVCSFLCVVVCCMLSLLFRFRLRCLLARCVVLVVYCLTYSVSCACCSLFVFVGRSLLCVCLSSVLCVCLCLLYAVCYSFDGCLLFVVCCVLCVVCCLLLVGS